MSSTAFPHWSVEPLPAEEELKLLEGGRAGDERARQMLIERNVWLVLDCVRDFQVSFNRLLAERLIPLGIIELIRAVNTFTLEQGVPFRTWARQRIERELARGFREAAEALTAQRTATLEPPTIPEFRTEEEEAEFWASHSVADFYQDTEPVKNLPVADELTDSIKERARSKRPVTLRLEEVQIDSAKAIARRKGLPYQTLIRTWITDAIRRETSPASP